MAVALDADQEQLVHFSFPIMKQEDTAEINPIDGTPDILIMGKATDGTVDADRQIVDPEWSAAALKEWIATGGNVRMSHDPKRPVGKGQDVQVTMDGHYVTSKICDPLAKHFIRNGVLNDYSVGISSPHIKYGPDKALDPRGSATGGIITGRPDGLSKIAELSVVDRGSNFNSKFQITRKSAGDDVEFVGKMIGDEDEITKAAPPALLTKAVAPAPPAGIDTWTAPEDLSISFTPNDLMKIVQGKIIDQHYDELALKAIAEAERAVYKRDIDTATRRRLAADGKALPNLSYPIENTEDLGNAAHLARTGHGDVAAARRLIARRARELGVANPLDEGDEVKKISGDEGTMAVAEAVAQAPEAVKEAEPDVIKDPEPEAEPKQRPVKKAKKPKKGARKLPPWLNKPKDGDDDGDSDDDDKADKAAHCGLDHEHTEKCHTPPSVAAGVTASPMNAAPVPASLPESDPVPSTVSKAGTPQSTSGASEAPAMQPVPAHREPDGAPMEAFEVDAGMEDGDEGSEKASRLEAATKARELAPDPEVAAILRFKAAGIDDALGRLHDLTCPAYHPEDVAKHHPFADFSQIDVGAFQRKAVQAAAGRDIASAMAAQEVWQAAVTLKGADPAWLNDCRLDAYKAFRDANPGPSSAPSPGSISPQRFNRPCITDGHAAESAGHDGPNTSPQVATSAPNAQSFDRPPLASGHQSPSPSHMKQGGGEYPARQGVPTQISYQHQEKDQARMALVRMHDQISRQFPEVCPLDSPDSRPLRGQQPEHKPVPPIAGIGKAIEPASADEITPGFPAPAAGIFKAPVEDEFSDDVVYKAFKKMRKKLGKKVLSGKMTVDEARAKLGRQFTQKGAEPQEPAPEVQKSATVTDRHVVQPLTVDVSATADLLKSALAEAVAPLAAELTSTKALLAEQQEAFTTKLAEQQKVIDAIADQPDPSTAAFSGLAFNPVRKSARPAAVVDQAEIAERTQQAMIRELRNQYNSASDPAAREAAYAVLCKMQGA